MEAHDFTLRPAAESDRTYLERLFYLTEVHGDETLPVGDDFPEQLGRYVGAWSADQGGLIVVSADGIPAGGVWLRAGADRRPAHGFVEAALPELAIAVEGRFAGCGLGGRLLTAILDQARGAGHPGLSLAVEDGHVRASRLYRKLGFTLVEHRAELGCEVMEYRFDAT